MRRRMVVVLAIALAAIVSQTPTAKAGSSTQGFVNVGTAEADGTSTNDINGAATLTIGDLSTNTTQTGFFVGLSHQDLGQVTFSTTVGSNDSLSFGDSDFGTFTSTSLKVLAPFREPLRFTSWVITLPEPRVDRVGWPVLASALLSLPLEAVPVPVSRTPVCSRFRPPAGFRPPAYRSRPA